jgi:uncharacterized protein YneF (UPF0154 family)
MALAIVLGLTLAVVAPVLVGQWLAYREEK